MQAPASEHHLAAVREALRAVEPQVAALVAEHRRTSRRWYPHEVVPWGEGRDFAAEPWRPEHCQLRPEVVVALETNLLTEDNLPYYHAQIARSFGLLGAATDGELAEGAEPSPWRAWNRLWTAEESKHAIAMRDYIHVTRAMDPQVLEDDRHLAMEVGFDRHFGDPLELFAYTSAQELATRVAHLRTGQKSEDPTLLKLMQLVARDENFHYLFYRGVTKAVLAIAPDLMLAALVKQLYAFEMPGTGMRDFESRQRTIASAAIYGAREHRDLVIAPLLGFLALEQLTGLSPTAEKARDRLLRLPLVIGKLVDRQDRALGRTVTAEPVALGA
jgi:acyl-[acyl-carrier-protein] desaturase